MTNKKSDLISRYFSYQVDDIENDIVVLEHNTLLLEEKNFDKRIDAIDFIDFHILDRIEGLLTETNYLDQLILLKNRAEKVKSQLETIDVKLFQKLQDNIKKRVYTNDAFRSMIYQYVDFNLADSALQQETGYDNLDIFINGILSFKDVPEQTLQREPGMVYYQKTPARIIFEMLDKLPITRDDVFVDLGSGLGFVVILLNLLTDAKAKGIEFEPAFCNYAIDCATNLNIQNVEFINADARHADYSSGNIFFMYTPFDGGIMDDVLALLKKEALSRKIKIVTYGPCSINVALQSWLQCETPSDDIYKLKMFSSI